jgi:phosphoribosyl 1,2-cyclic phosphodiesterase
MLEICAIASGSNGNCYYIGNEKDAVLIDAGISCKQILLRMGQKGLMPQKIRAVFISHEHSDHIRGVRVLSKRLNIPVWLTAKTYYASYKNMQPAYVKFFTPGTELHAGELKIYPFLKNHDGAEPCSFRVEYKNKNVGVFTDIGEPCENVICQLAKCNALFLETNYDEEMLINGSYPFFLKKRIASSLGHLSNIQAFKLLEALNGNNLKYVLLSHISAENNTPDLALSALSKLSAKYNIRLTSRTGAADLIVL